MLIYLFVFVVDCCVSFVLFLFPAIATATESKAKANQPNFHYWSTLTSAHSAPAVVTSHAKHRGHGTSLDSGGLGIGTAK